jgi:hypothetical protein
LLPLFISDDEGVENMEMLYEEMNGERSVESHGNENSLHIPTFSELLEQEDDWDWL